MPPARHRKHSRAGIPLEPWLSELGMRDATLHLGADVWVGVAACDLPAPSLSLTFSDLSCSYVPPDPPWRKYRDPASTQCQAITGLGSLARGRG